MCKQERPWPGQNYDGYVAAGAGFICNLNAACFTLQLIACALQILGAMCASALVAALTPSDVYVGMGDGAPGCFDAKTASSEITKSQVFGWEVSPIPSIKTLSLD